MTFLEKIKKSSIFKLPNVIVIIIFLIFCIGMINFWFKVGAPHMYYHQRRLGKSVFEAKKIATSFGILHSFLMFLGFPLPLLGHFYLIISIIKRLCVRKIPSRLKILFFIFSVCGAIFLGLAIYLIPIPKQTGNFIGGFAIWLLISIVLLMIIFFSWIIKKLILKLRSS